MTDYVPSNPGYYCLDIHFGWIRFESYIEMMAYYGHSECECRVVADPITENVV